MFNKKSIVLSLVAVGVLSACSSTNSTKFEERTNKNQDYSDLHFQLKRDMEFQRERRSIGRVLDDENYVNHRNMYVERERRVQLPLLFREEISYVSKEEKSVQEFTSEVFRNTGILLEVTRNRRMGGGDESSGDEGFIQDSAFDLASLMQPNIMQDGLSPDMMGGSRGSNEREELKIKPFDYAGSFESFLDYFSVLHDLKWNYDENTGKVFIYETDIRTFYVYEDDVSITSSNSISTQSSSSAEGASTGNNQSVSYSNQSVPWDDIENTVNNLLSDNGRVSFNRRNGKVIVEDNDFVLSKIEDYIGKVNQAATKQVAGRVDIITVKLSDSQNFGVNVNYLNDALSNNLLGGFTGSLNLGGNIDGGGFGGNALSIENDTGFTGLLGFLSTMGTVNLSSSTDFNTLNNNAVSFQITSNEEYIQKYSAESNNLGSRDNFSVETGIIQDGITMNVTPRIIGDQVRMNFSVALSTNDGFNPDSPVPQIQLPRTSNRNFNQSIISNNGETRVIVAYTRDSGSTSSSGPGSSKLWFIGGNERFEEEKEVILITSTVYFDVQ